MTTYLATRHNIAYEDYGEYIKEFDMVQTITWEWLKSQRYSFEFLNRTREKITRLFFDFDFKVDNKDKIKEQEVVRVLTKNSNIYNFVFTNGSYEEKLSFHVIFQNIYIEKPKFDVSLYDFSKIFDGLEESLKDEMVSSVDRGVYQNKTCFRLPYGEMKNKPNIHLPMKNTEPHQYLLMNVPSVYECYDEIGRPLVTILRKKEEEKEEKVNIMLVDDEDEKDPTERSEKMMEMLEIVKKERFREYAEWFKLLCLMNSNGLKKEDFLRFSKESGYAQYDENQCLGKWYNIGEKKERLGFPTIHKWLEEDGIDWKALFCKKKGKMMSALLKAWHQYGTLTDLAIAEIFFENYGDSLYSTPIGWIHYNQKKGWEIGDESTVIYPLMKCIGEKMNHFVRKMKIKDEDEKEFKKKQQALLKETVKLCSYSACVKIVKTAQILFKNEMILKDFDRFPFWFCFSDQKAIDMKTGAIFDIKKEHMILTTCGYPLPERIEKDVQDAKNIVLSIFGEYYDSYASMLAYHFQAGNPQQNVYIQTGSASNGKSINGNLMRNALGLYGGILPIDQLTQNASGRDSANSAMAGMRGKRYCQLNEPEDDNQTLTLKVARVKELSGEPEITVREIFQKSTSMRVDFTMSILCNDIPKLSKNDGGVERRIKVIKYPYKFVDQPTEDFHRKRDDNIKTRSESDKSLHYGFLWLMMDIFKKTQGKFIINDEIKNESAEYMRQNNPIADFMIEYEESTDFIRQKVLYASYLGWCKNTYKDPVSDRKFAEFLTQLKVKVIKDTHHGNKVFIKAISI